MQESEFSLDGYNLFYSYVGDEKYRGILMYVDNNLQSSQVEINSEYEESLLIQLAENHTKNIIIGTFYRSPGRSVQNDLYMCELINHINMQYPGKKLLFGDFNINNINWVKWSVGANNSNNSSDSKLIDCLRKNLFTSMLQIQLGQEDLRILTY